MGKNLKLKFSRSFQLCRSQKPCSFSDPVVRVTHKLSPFNAKAKDINDCKLPSPPPPTPELNFDHYPYPSNPKKQPVISINKLDDHPTNKTNEDKKKDNKKGKASNVLSEEEDGQVLLSRRFKHNTSCEYSQSMGSSSSEESDHNVIECMDQKSKKVGYSENNNNNNNNSTKKMKTKLGKQVSGRWNKPNTPQEKAVWLLKKQMPCRVDGKMRESVAVVLNSEDPYEDFKWSMLDMILGSQLFEAKDLEELLQCFLSLNSREYHELIVEAFSYIWEALFCGSSVDQKQKRRALLLLSNKRDYARIMSDLYSLSI